MRRMLIVFLMLMPMIASAQVREGKQIGGDCRLTWDAPRTNTNGTPVTDLKEFHLFISMTKGQYDRSKPIKIPFPTREISCAQARILLDGQYYATIIAIDSAGHASKQSVDTPFYRDTTVPNAIGTMGVTGFDRTPSVRHDIPPESSDEKE